MLLTQKPQQCRCPQRGSRFAKRILNCLANGAPCQNTSWANRLSQFLWSISFSNTCLCKSPLLPSSPKKSFAKCFLNLLNFLVACQIGFTQAERQKCHFPPDKPRAGVVCELARTSQHLQCLLGFFDTAVYEKTHSQNLLAKQAFRKPRKKREFRYTWFFIQRTAAYFSEGFSRLPHLYRNPKP